MNLVEERLVGVPVPEIHWVINEVHAVESVAAKIPCRVFCRFFNCARHVAVKGVKVDADLLERAEVPRHVWRLDGNCSPWLGASGEDARRIRPRPVFRAHDVGASKRAKECAAHLALRFAVVAQRHPNIVASRPGVAVPFDLAESQDVGCAVELPDGNGRLTVGNDVPSLAAPVAKVAVADWLACVGAVVKLRAIRID